MKVAAFGDNCIDFYPKLGRHYVTGNVVDFALNLRAQGIATSVVSVTGNDAYGRQVLADLQAAGLDTSHLRVDEGATPVCFMELIGRERVHGKYEEGVMEGVVFTGEQVNYAAGHDHVHLAFYGHAEGHLPLLKEKGCATSFDYSDDLEAKLVDDTIPFVDYAFFSYKEDDGYIRDFLQDKGAKGARVAVATFGAKGSLAWDGAAFTKGGIVPAEVVNTIGAGDSFIAGYIAGVIKGLDVAGCLQNGARIAAEVVSVFGPCKATDENEGGR